MKGTIRNIRGSGIKVLAKLKMALLKNSLSAKPLKVMERVGYIESATLYGPNLTEAI